MSFADAAEDAGQLASYHTALDNFYGPDVATNVDADRANLAAASFDGFGTDTSAADQNADDASIVGNKQNGL